MVDRNEMNRTVRAAPRSKVRLLNQHICMTSLCCRSPLTGGKHVKASKFCALHIGVENDGTSMAHQAYSGHHFPQQHWQRHLIQTPPIQFCSKIRLERYLKMMMPVFL